ncbi:MAG: EamA family transporter [Emergencia sp.]
MWLLTAGLSAVFIGISTILSKIGIRHANPYITGAVTNTVLLAAFAGTAGFAGSFGQVSSMGGWTWVSVIASGLVLSISWIFYFLGLKGGSVSVFLAIQSLTVIVSTALCRIFLGEEITGYMIAGTVLIIGGTLLMMNRRELAALKGKGLIRGENRWILFSGLSAVFAAVSYVIVKADTAPVDTNVTSTFRYILVVTVLWLILFTKLQRGPEKSVSGSFGEITGKTWIFILLGAAASGAGHVLVYKALFLGKAAVIMTIYRMGMVISIVLSRVFLHERLGVKGWIALLLLAAGVVLFAAGR